MTQPAPAPSPIAEQLEQQVEPSCRHHWVIQPATGPVSQGDCQICGEAREFKNYIEASTWGDDKSGSRTTARAKADVNRTVSKVVVEEDEVEE